MSEHYRGPDLLISELADLISNISHGMWKRGLSEAHEIKECEAFDEVLKTLNEIADSQA